MGVKRYFLLTIDGGSYLGPAAYYRLVSRYRDFLSAGYLRVRFEDFERTHLKGHGWRKKIVPLYKHLRDQVGGIGKLQELKTRNPSKDYAYRITQQYITDLTGYPPVQ